MAYPTGPMAASGPGRVRPGVVSIAGYLMFLVVALQVIGTILSLAYLGDIQDAYEKAYAQVDNGDDFASFAVITVVVLSILYLLLAAGLVVLAIFNNRGKNPARITTWVIGGIFLCCNGFSLLGTAAGSTTGFGGGQGDPDMPSSEELQDALSTAIPSWLNTVTTVLTVITFLALLAALILLALPPANDFFRKPQEEWQPPAGGQPGYLAYPAYPQSGQPGTPPAYPQPGTGTPPTAPPPAAPPASGGQQPPQDQPRGDS